MTHPTRDIFRQLIDEELAAVGKPPTTLFRKRLVKHIINSERKHLTTRQQLLWDIMLANKLIGEV